MNYQAKAPITGLCLIESLKKVGLLYTIGSLSGETNGSPYVWLYVNERLTDFEQYWGVCPGGEIRQVDINGQTAEIASGIAWMTNQRPKPGEKREWVCDASGNSFIIRWQVNDLRMEISVVANSLVKIVFISLNKI